MRTISREDWQRLHGAYKTVDEKGQRYALRLEPGTGATVLEPVEVVDTGPEDAESSSEC